MDSTCSQQSYYKCLANRFKAMDFQKESTELLRAMKNTTKSECPFEEVCIPIPLPLGPKDDIPICRELKSFSRRSQESCYMIALDRLIKDQEKHCKNLCKVKEFDVGKSFEPHDVFTNSENMLAFG